ncbi:MAG: hypothetical protein CVV25_13060 [Ignavibacteriae bacterium HGW-Ignavibacteriae-4]|jgi:hypothetical protein|nr:MAG: hypothetical protein CVV25_13060 [Ignavibacteriae bacterium HGW-Ignavibacteriae-4]
MNYLVLILIFISLNDSFSKLGHVNASVERIEIDSNGFYSRITLYNDGQYIGLSGSSSDYPNCVAYSSDFGTNWTIVDRMEKPNFTYEYTKYYVDFKDIYFNNSEQLIIFSDNNKFFQYGLNPLERDEYLLQNEFSIEDGRSLDVMLSKKDGDEYYIYTRKNNSTTYNDYSSITILNHKSKTRKNIPFDMKKIQKLTDFRIGERDDSPYYDDEFLTKDNCFFATIANWIDVGEEYPILTRSLIKIRDLENPEWEVVNIRFTDSIANHFIYFDDCQNGFLSTSKTYQLLYPRLYSTSDGGKTWQKIYEDDEYKFVFKSFRRANDSTLFAFSGLSDIFRSTDNGFNWSRIESENIGRISDFQIIDGRTLLVAYNENTIAKVTINENVTGIVESNNNLEVSPPYPQPARTDVTIALDKSNFIIYEKDIIIYDFLGRKLENQFIEINDTSIRWDCSTAQPGIYLINIKHGTEEKAVKVVVE